MAWLGASARDPRRAVVWGVVVLVVVAAAGWAVYAAQPRLTTVTNGVSVCLPGNANGEGLVSIEIFRNDSGQPVTVTTFEPAGSVGLEVIGAYFVPDGNPGHGVQNDAALVPRGFSFDPVPPGDRVTLAVGLKLSDPDAPGRFMGGALRSDNSILFGGSVGTSAMGYAMMPNGQTCEGE